MKKPFILVVLMLIAFTQIYSQTYVNASASGSNNGTSWTNAYTNLQTAITATSAGNEVWVAAGTYTPSVNTSFVMKEGVKVYGGFTSGMTLLSSRNWATNVTTLQGNNRSVASFASGLTVATVLDGFTITGGVGTGVSGIASGGGISLVSASPTLAHLSINANSAANGGGINMNGTSGPTISNTIVSSNTVTAAGGGIYITGSGSPVLTSIVIQNNTAATEGGGIVQTNAASSGNLTITNAVFYSNTGLWGGGIYSLFGSTLKVTNALFANNNSTQNTAFGAGGISNNTTVITVSNSTFYNNIVGGSAAAPGIQFLNSVAANRVNNSVFFSTGETAATLLNLTFNGTAPTFNNSYIPTTTGSGTTFIAGTGNIAGIINPFYGTDPMNLATLKGGDGVWMTADDGLHLAVGSTANSTGSNALIPGGITTDIAAATRIQNTTVDMGAYEGAYAVVVPVKLISFNGALRNGMAQLQWKTAEEENFSHFEIEKNYDGQPFNKTGSVYAKGSGSNYYFSLAQVEPKANYRLRIVDKDGKVEYSKTIRLYQEISTGFLQVYPNPARENINVQVNEMATLRISDATGRVVKMQQVVKGVNPVDINNLERGIYFVDVNGSKTQFVKQ